MALTPLQLADVCFLNGGAQQCRYLDEDVNDAGVLIHVCKKLSPDRKIIDEEVAEELATMAAANQDPKTTGHELGDNCQGYVVLKTKAQGYDLTP